jgi:anaerobic ribonucleoside-triphosphate reductase activating protein
MANTQRLKYLGHSIVFQEVPNEISLAINISGCPYKCRGCHSSYLWEYKGRYVGDDIEALINEHDGITCVCFMGGDQNQKELTDLLINIHKHRLKAALYTGCNFMSDLHIRVLGNLDYCKIGHYDANRGGLDNPNTNQRMLAWDWKNGKWNDITYKFQKGYHNG